MTLASSIIPSEQVEMQSDCKLNDGGGATSEQTSG